MTLYLETLNLKSIIELWQSSKTAQNFATLNIHFSAMIRVCYILESMQHFSALISKMYIILSNKQKNLVLNLILLHRLRSMPSRHITLFKVCKMSSLKTLFIQTIIFVNSCHAYMCKLIPLLENDIGIRSNSGVCLLPNHAILFHHVIDSISMFMH